MAIFQVKTESPAVRCEICHQADLFNPATGQCIRCTHIPAALTAPQANQSSPDQRPGLFFFGNIEHLTGWHLRNARIGSFTSILPFGVILILAYGFGAFDSDPIFSPFIFFLISLISGAFTGLLVGRAILSPTGYQSLNDLKDCGAGKSIFVTVSLLFLTAFFLALTIGVTETAKFLGSHPGLILILVIVSMLSGGITSNALVKLERGNLFERR
jgi:hypothetical protein